MNKDKILSNLWDRNMISCNFMLNREDEDNIPVLKPIPTSFPTYINIFTYYDAANFLLEYKLNNAKIL